MTRYKNLSQGSGVLAYEIGDDYITVQFNSGDTYLYNFETTGRNEVEKMKMLAVQGRGLSTYISRIIRENYKEKL